MIPAKRQSKTQTQENYCGTPAEHLVFELQLT
jgi:hypothetical protein